MRQIERALRGALMVLAALGVAAYGAAGLVTVGDIVGRMVGLPIVGVVDLVQLAVLTGTGLVLPYAFLSAAHVSVDFVVNALPRPVAATLAGLSAALTAVLLALMLWKGFATFEMRTMFGDRSQQLGIPVAWYWYPLLGGLVASLVGAVLHGVATIRAEPSDAGTVPPRQPA